MSEPETVSLRRRRARFFMYRQIMPLMDAARFAFGTFDDKAEADVPVRLLKRTVRLRPGTSDLMVLRKIFVDDEYRLPFDIKPKVIVDAGANIGCATLGFRLCYPDAVIHAIEPEEANFRLLQQNCGSLSNVHLHRAALWPKPGFISLTNPLNEPWSFTCEDASAGVPVLTMEDVLKHCGGPIDLLKLDIEGAEKVLFETAPQRWLPQVRVIAIELHDRFTPGCSQAMYRAIIDLPFQQEVRGENVFVLLQP